MNLLDSKMIQTRFEKEFFIDQMSNIELKSFKYPEKNYPFYEMIVGLEINRIRGNEFYGTEKRYFGIKMSEDLQYISLFEPDLQSIFAGKNEQEKQAVIELIDYLLTKSAHFKELITTKVANLKQSNVVYDQEIKEINAELAFLEKLLTICFEEVHFALKDKNIA